MSNPILKTGCYYVRFRPAVRDERIDHYDGVLRVTRENDKGELADPAKPDLKDVIHASADLYAHYRNPFDFPDEDKILGAHQAKDAPQEVPFFPRRMYRVYLFATETHENMPEPRNVMMRLDTFLFDQAASQFQKRGSLLAILKQGPDDPTKPQPGDAMPDPADKDLEALIQRKVGKEYPHQFLRGDLFDEQAGVPKGIVQAAWVCESLRKAELEIDCVTGLLPPKDNKDPLNLKKWPDALKGSGWKMKCDFNPGSVIDEPPPAWGDPIGSAGLWTLSELHQVMLQWRNALNLDKARLWDYYALCVHEIYGFERGVSFDAGVDMDNVPDQIVALGANWLFPLDEVPNPPDLPEGHPRRFKYGEWAGKPLKDTGGYFRTAAHEVGHAMGLGHNHEDDCLMNTTDVIAENARPTLPFPANVQWFFTLKDQARLRHLPDAVVRSDIVYRGDQVVMADEAGSAAGLRLHVRAHLDSVGYGAPVRVEFIIENTGDEVIGVPDNLSFKSGHVFGVVRDPRGTPYRVKPVTTRLDEEPRIELKPGYKAATRSLTLLRGPDGALFRVPGVHEVHVGVYWFDPLSHRHHSAWGSCRVTISAPMDDLHRVAALRLLGSPEALLSLAIGGDHLGEGRKAMAAALGNSALRPHVGVIECKRLLKRFHIYKVTSLKPLKIGYIDTRPVNLEEAFKHIDRYTVCAIDEIVTMARLMTDVNESDKNAIDSTSGKKFWTAAAEASFEDTAKLLKRRLEDMVNHGRIDPVTHCDVIDAVDKLVSGNRFVPPPTPSSSHSPSPLPPS
jgi:hypothetical protein